MQTSPVYAKVPFEDENWFTGKLYVKVSSIYNRYLLLVIKSAYQEAVGLIKFKIYAMLCIISAMFAIYGVHDTWRSK